ARTTDAIELFRNRPAWLRHVSDEDDGLARRAHAHQRRRGFRVDVTPIMHHAPHIAEQQIIAISNGIDGSDQFGHARSISSILAALASACSGPAPYSQRRTKSANAFCGAMCFSCMGRTVRKN